MIQTVKRNGMTSFYKHVSDKVIQIIGVVSDEEVELTNTNPSLLDEEQVVRINKILKEISEDVE